MKNLTPSEIRTKIKRLKEQNELERLCLRTWTERKNEDILEKKIAEQEEIIQQANERIVVLQHQFKIAPKEIGKIKQRIRYNNKILANLIHHKQISQLLKMAEEINKYKETDDGQEHIS